jgi:hypothetical protein
MLQELRIKVWSAAIAAAANSLQPAALGYCALIIALAILRAFAHTIRRSLAASWREIPRREIPRREIPRREIPRTELRALQARLVSVRAARRTFGAKENRHA